MLKPTLTIAQVKNDMVRDLTLVLKTDINPFKSFTFIPQSNNGVMFRCHVVNLVNGIFYGIKVCFYH